MTWFDDALLDDEGALARADPGLRRLAGAGARVRRDAGEARDAVAGSGTSGGAGALDRPRALVLVGPHAALVRSAVERRCPVPVVAWAGPGLPGWVGGLDLVVALDPRPDDPGHEIADDEEERRLAVAVAVAEAVRRGTPVVLAGPPGGLAARHAVGRDTLVLPCESADAVVVVVLEHLHRLGLGPASDADAVAEALDDVARAASPHREADLNPAKGLALVLAEASVLVWGAGAVQQDAAQRVAAALRRTTARPALAGEADLLLPVLAQVRTRDLFADPDPAAPPRPVLVVLGDGEGDDEGDGRDPGPSGPALARLTGTARARGVRVETPHVATDRGPVARWAAHGLLGDYVAAYLALGTVED